MTLLSSMLRFFRPLLYVMSSYFVINIMSSLPFLLVQFVSYFHYVCFLNLISMYLLSPSSSLITLSYNNPSLLLLFSPLYLSYITIDSLCGCSEQLTGDSDSVPFNRLFCSMPPISINFSRWSFCTALWCAVLCCSVYSVLLFRTSPSVLPQMRIFFICSYIAHILSSFKKRIRYSSHSISPCA